MGTSLNSYSAWRRGDVRESVEGSNLRYARPDLEVHAKYTFHPHQRVTTEGKDMEQFAKVFESHDRQILVKKVRIATVILRCVYQR